MRVGDEGLDPRFVLREEGVDVGLVKEARALGLGQDEVGEGEEAEVGVEGDPGDDVPGPGFEEGEEAEGDPVHEPWGQLGGVGGAEGFVGGEDGEEDREEGAGGGVVSRDAVEE